MSTKLAQRLVEPDYWTCPHGQRKRPMPIETYGPEVADICAKANFAPDPQQELGLDLIFAIRPDGSPASFTFCVICCRQNLKTGLFKQAALGWLFVTEQPLVVWSSHEMSTTNEAQRELGDVMLDSPSLRRRMMTNDNDGIYYANGSERIELANGQRIMFKARTNTGGRGLAAPKIILDEAFALKPSMLGSLLPLVTAQKDPQILYGSSAGKNDSDALRDIRDRGRQAMSPRMSYLEWLAPHEDCADEDCQHPKNAAELGLDCALDRESLIISANPTIATGRIAIDTIRDLRQELPPDEFMRECLGWWDDPPPTGFNIFPNWLGVGVDITDVNWTRPAPAAIAIAVSVDRAWASIGVASGGDRPHIGSHKRARGVDWVVAEAVRIQSQYGVPVAIAGRGPAASLIDALAAVGVEPVVAGIDDYQDACADLFDRIEAGTVEHGHYNDLNEAVSVAAWTAGERRVWTRKSGDVSMLEAVTLALWVSEQETESVYATRDLVIL